METNKQELEKGIENLSLYSSNDVAMLEKGIENLSLYSSNDVAMLEEEPENHIENLCLHNSGCVVMLEEQPTQNCVMLMSSDGVKFKVDKAVARQSQILSFVMEDTAAETIVTYNVDSKTLAMVIQYCQYHVLNDNIATDVEINTWDTEFFNTDETTLSNLMRAADYLNIENLLNQTITIIRRRAANAMF